MALRTQNAVIALCIHPREITRLATLDRSSSYCHAMGLSFSVSQSHTPAEHLFTYERLTLDSPQRLRTVHLAGLMMELTSDEMLEQHYSNRYDIATYRTIIGNSTHDNAIRNQDIFPKVVSQCHASYRNVAMSYRNVARHVHAVTAIYQMAQTGFRTLLNYEENSLTLHIIAGFL